MAALGALQRGGDAGFAQRSCDGGDARDDRGVRVSRSGRVSCGGRASHDVRTAQTARRPHRLRGGWWAYALLTALVLVVGIGLIAYPFVSDYLERREQARLIDLQQDAVSAASDSELAAEMAACVSYNDRLVNEAILVSDPFDPTNQSVVTEEEYATRLNLADDGVMATIVIPSCNVRVPIYHGTSDEVLQQGAGHLVATSLPVGGESTHCVVAGHNGLPSVRIFDDIDKLAVGDYFVVQVLGEEHAYRVTSTEVVEPGDTESCRIVEGKDLMTLITCTPYGVNTHRLLVHAERCELPEEWLESEREESAQLYVEPSRALLPLVLAGAGGGIGIIVARAYLRVRRRKKRRQPKHMRTSRRRA